MLSVENKRTSFLPFHQPILGGAELNEIAQALESGWLTRGPKTQAFEEMFASYIGAPHAVGVNSATAGLHLALAALDIGPGDEVITTPITYCATPNEIEHAGATPIFADVDPQTYLLDPDAVERAITPRTKALMPVHLYGQSADMDRLRNIARKHGLAIVEDAAHAIETTWRDEKIGTIGDFTVFSFYPTKNITTGEGGMLTTMRADLAERARRLSLHGLSKEVWKRHGEADTGAYRLLERGYKYHMFDLLAALGLAQLPNVDQWRSIRERLWNRYHERLARIPGVRAIPHRMPGKHAYHLLAIELDPDTIGISRDETAAALRESNIGTGIHYHAMHLQPYYAQRYALRPEDFPHATRASERMLSLPLYPRMTEQDADDVTASLHAAVIRASRT
jgi:dTDP-4-amino-4,6-dideoxygalactose transaminase